MKKINKLIKIGGLLDLKMASNGINNVRDVSLRQWGHFIYDVNTQQKLLDSVLSKAISDFHKEIITDLKDDNIVRDSMVEIFQKIKPNKYEYNFICNFHKAEHVMQNEFEATYWKGEKLYELEVNIEFINVIDKNE